MLHPIRLLVLLVFAGCTAAGPPRAGDRVEPVPDAPGAVPRPIYRYAPGTLVYRITNEATITAAGDSLAMPESLTTTVLIRYNVEDAGGVLDVRGTVDSFSIQGATRTSAPATPALLPIAFRATLHYDGTVLSFEGLADTACASPGGPLLAAARELLPAIPRPLVLGERWRDTTRSTVCRGDVPVTTTAVQQYTVRGADTFQGSPAVRVTRQSEITLAGSGTQAVQEVTLTGTGNARTELYLDPLTGRFLGSTGEYAADIAFATPRLRQLFTQRVRQRIILE